MLTCSAGTWSNKPTHFAYGWKVNGRAKHGAGSRRLKVTRALRRHRVQCIVTPSNAAGRTTAVTAPYRVR